jgi:hypothetical protein
LEKEKVEGKIYRREWKEADSWKPIKVRDDIKEQREMVRYTDKKRGRINLKWKKLRMTIQWQREQNSGMRRRIGTYYCRIK